MPRLSILVELDEGESEALIVLGRTRSAHRVVTIDPPARELRELDGTLLIRWATVPAVPARIELEYWGVAPSVEVRKLGAGEFDTLDRDDLPKRSDPVRLRQWRRDAASSIADHRSARNFFNGLDEGTTVFDVARDDLKALLLALFEERLADDPPTAAYPVSDYIRTAIDVTAQQFTDLFDRSFDSQQELEDAFDLFARGELSMLEVELPEGVESLDAGLACQPDSILMFLFAEFAHLCVTLRVRTNGRFDSPCVWKELLPTLIFAHGRFCATYGHGGRFEYAAVTRGIHRRRHGLTSVRTERALALPAIRANPLQAWRSQAREGVIRGRP